MPTQHACRRPAPTVRWGTLPPRPDAEGVFPGRPRRYFDYVNFNATGYRPLITTLYAVVLGCLRKTFSRLLVLIVAMGYGVVLPYLGAVQKKARAALH